MSDETTPDPSPWPPPGQQPTEPYSSPQYQPPLPNPPQYSAAPQYPTQQYPTQQHPATPGYPSQYSDYGAYSAPTTGYDVFGGYQPPAAPTQPATDPSPGDGRSGSNRRRALLLPLLVAALVGGGVGGGIVAIADHNSNSGGTNSAGLSLSVQTPQSTAKIDGSVAAAAARIMPSVVTINVSGQSESGTGSGVIIRSDGYILTNNHVVAVASGGGQIQVLTRDGRLASATVVGTDTSDDLAVVKVNLTGLAAATFGNSRSLVVGQSVVAVGAPLGLSNTVTSGIVSNTARPVQTGDTSTTTAVFDAIQTDAAINPGNSGGPLVDLMGNVVGIDAAIATANSGGVTVPGQTAQSGSIGIGFAIPSDEASRIAGQLITSAHATHAILGVSVNGANTSQTTIQNTVGATIAAVTADGPAAKAGLKVGDVVTKVNDQLITEDIDLVAAVRSYAPGQTVTLTYTRGGVTQTTQATLGTAAS